MDEEAGKPAKLRSWEAGLSTTWEGHMQGSVVR